MAKTCPSGLERNLYISGLGGGGALVLILQKIFE